MIVKIENRVETHRFLSNLMGRCFIKTNVIRKDLQDINQYFIPSSEIPTKDEPGVYLFLYIVDKENRVLSFRHTERVIYGIKSIGISDWCRGIDKGLPVDQSFARRVSELFFNCFETNGGIQIDLMGLYVNRLIFDDVNKLGFIYQGVVDNLENVKSTKANADFFDFLILSKQEAFNQNTEYDHWSSQVVFSMFHPDPHR